MQQVSCDNFFDAVKREKGLKLEPKVFPARAGRNYRGGRYEFDERHQHIVCDTGERFDVERGYDNRGSEAWYVSAPAGVDIARSSTGGCCSGGDQVGVADEDCSHRERTYPDWQKVEGVRSPTAHGPSRAAQNGMAGQHLGAAPSRRRPWSRGPLRHPGDAPGAALRAGRGRQRPDARPWRNDGRRLARPRSEDQVCAMT